MIELQKELDLGQKQLLVEKLELAGFAFAAWKLPNIDKVQLIISLSQVKKKSDFQLEELSAGFVINEFKDNHPVNPYYLPADIIIRDEELFVDPRVTASSLDAFQESIKIASRRSIKKNFKVPHAPFGDFERKVELAVDQIKSGTFDKVVLSRYKDVPLPDSFSSWEFFQKISKKYPNAFTSLTFVPGKGTWIGATPELLLSNDSNSFRTVSLAGTKRLEDDQELSEIAWTQKEIEEQAFVSRYVINCFKKIRLREFHEHGPKTIRAGNLAHLKTEFIVDYNEVSFDKLADQMLELLHPTSAVCGMPIEETKPWIDKVEAYDRAFYSGFLGPIHFNGATQLFVNLRSMRVYENSIRFFAGAGVTEDSIPSKEFEETEMKMDILKSNL